MDVAAHLCTRTDRRPGVHHRSRTDPGSDVDVAGHDDDPGLAVCPVANRAGGDHSHPLARQSRLQGDLVVELERSDLVRLHPSETEIEQDRLLDPEVDGPHPVHLLGNAQFATVEHADCRLDRGASLFDGDFALEGGLDQFGFKHSITASAARSHSASVGTRAKRRKPSPPPPNARPGDTTIPASRSREVAARSSSTSTHM